MKTFEDAFRQAVVDQKWDSSKQAQILMDYIRDGTPPNAEQWIKYHTEPLSRICIIATIHVLIETDSIDNAECILSNTMHNSPGISFWSKKKSSNAIKRVQIKIHDKFPNLDFLADDSGFRRGQRL